MKHLQPMKPPRADVITDFINAKFVATLDLNPGLAIRAFQDIIEEFTLQFQKF